MKKLTDPLTSAGLWRHRRPKRFGRDDVTYQAGMSLLEGRGLVEDWGCGTCYARRFLPQEQPYRGVDGSPGYADLVVDLVDYQSDVPCIFMRHVLEHNWCWRRILENALESFRDRFVLVLFTPLVEGETTRLNSPKRKIPDLSLSRCELEHALVLFKWRRETFYTRCGEETVFLVEKQTNA